MIAEDRQQGETTPEINAIDAPASTHGYSRCRALMPLFYWQAIGSAPQLEHIRPAVGAVTGSVQPWLPTSSAVDVGDRAGCASATDDCVDCRVRVVLGCLSMLNLTVRL